jgi:uroporphyrinogen III methyltransferase / synthase
MDRQEVRQGKVYLIGAGPGDPGLMTLRGKDILCKADVIIYDYLANKIFLEYAKPRAELIYVGKKGGDHTMGQADINRLIVKKSRTGKSVARLKGGDPFIFGRGGEEAQELAADGVPFEVVPGITSAISVPAYAGIPLTHRDHTATVAFVTGHEDPLKEESNIQWDKLATGVGTIVFLMGVGNLKKIALNLIHHGRSPDTPVAVIRRGTVAEQKTVSGNLVNIAERVENAGLRPPAIIVVGDVVGLRDELNWFETKPLFGKRIVVTRAREQASGFLKKLSSLGAECIQFPTIEIIDPDSWGPLDTAIRNLESYQWLLFTSVNGVKYFLQRLRFQGKDVRDLKGIKIGAIGPKTADQWHQLGIKPDLIPDEYRAEAVVESFKKWDTQGVRILIPRAAKAREVLPEQLRKMGARVDVVDAYRTISPKGDTSGIRNMLEKGAIHMVTFTSSSTVTNFVKMFGSEKQRLTDIWMKRVKVACIGPITADTARDQGFSVDLMPSDYTIEALTQAITDFFGA